MSSKDEESTSKIVGPAAMSLLKRQHEQEGGGWDDKNNEEDPPTSTTSWCDSSSSCSTSTTTSSRAAPRPRRKKTKKTWWCPALLVLLFLVLASTLVLFVAFRSTLILFPADFFAQQQEKEAEEDKKDGKRRELQQDDNCVLSEETPFAFLMPVELNSPDNCAGRAATDGGTFVFLSDKDKGQLENTVMASFTELAGRYCDPYFRNVSSVTIVRQGVSPSPSSQVGSGGSLTLEIEVQGTLRCQQSEEGCNVDNIGLFDFPNNGPADLQQEPMCLCPVVSNDTSIIASNRGPTEVEFMEFFGLRLASTVAPSLDCSDLQVAECTFGTAFQSALVITFIDPASARNSSELIRSEALRTLNELYMPDDPNVCYADPRTFQSVSVVFQEGRRQVQETVDNTSFGPMPAIPPSSLPATFPAAPAGPINGSEAPLLNFTTTSAPSESPTTTFGGPSTLTAILYVNGICSQCASEIFLSNDASARRRLDVSSFQEALAGRPEGRNLQAPINAIKSNCFCPIDSVVGEAPVPAIEQFKSTLEERLQLEITKIQELDPDDIVVDGNFGNGPYRYPCTDIVTTFKKNVTLEMQVTCGTAELSDDDKNLINLAYADAYNSMRSTVCDPFNLEVTSAKVVATGDLRAGGTSLPLRIEVTMACFGCDPLETNIYGFPHFSAENQTSELERRSRRYLHAADYLKTRRGQEEEGICSCNATLPRRAPLEADVTDALDLTLLQQEELIVHVPCIGNTTACDFGTTFTASALFEVELDVSVDPIEATEVMQTAFANALNRLIGGGNATQCNSLFGLVTDTKVFLEFVYNSVERNVNETARRQLQVLPTLAPTSALTFAYSWTASNSANSSEAPTASPTAVGTGPVSFLLDASGFCNGCPRELIFNNNVNGRRRIDQISTDNPGSASLTELRFLQDVTGAEPESECFCPIGSTEIVTDFEQISLLDIIQEEVTKVSNTTTVVGAVSGLTRVECVEETTFSTTINFRFSAFSWVINNQDDVQGLGDAIANIYNGLVEEFCDEYFRNSISLTYVAGSLQRSTVQAQRHNRDLQQNTQGCFNYRATFNVAGFCRGCEALGTPIPLFGNSTINRMLLVDEVTRRPSHLSRQRRVQEPAASSTCICDSTSLSKRSAPSLAAIRAGLAALIPDPLPWRQNPSICGLPVQVEIPCPIIPTGPSTTMTVRFYARRFDNGCLTAADLQRIALEFTTSFNSRKQSERFPCEPQYLQVSNVVIDQSALVGCRRELLRSSASDGGGGRESQGDSTSRRLRTDFSLILASLTVTGNIWATNLGAILADEGTNLMAAAADITDKSAGIYEIETGRATNSPSAMPSGFPSNFPSAFPSEFPSDEPSSQPSGDPTRKPSSFPSESPTDGACSTSSDSCTGTVVEVQQWCESFSGDDACCVRDSCNEFEPPCVWAGDATIFKGSCNGLDACNFGSASGPITVGAGSCIGNYACSGVASSVGQTISIGAGSCLECNACYEVGTSAATFVEIGDDACIGNCGDPPCSSVGWTKASSITIGTGSCQGGQACTNVGYTTASMISIGADSSQTSTGSCQGAFACESVAYTKGDTISIGASSCQGSNSCDQIAYTEGTTISIGSNSCVDEFSCGQIGFLAAATVTIDNNSCTGPSSCERVGREAAKSITIGIGSCLADSSCLEVGQNLASQVDILSSACTADICDNFCIGVDGVGFVQCAAVNSCEIICPKC